VKNLYNRVENLDELIRSVKLPYLAWKILFLVNKKADSNEIAGLLETDEQAVANSMDLLLKNELVFIDEEAPVEAEIQEKVPDLEETTILEEETEPVEEDIVDQLISEIPEEIVKEEAEEILDTSDIVESEEPLLETSEEEPIPFIEDEEPQNADDVLDELMNEVEEQESTETIEQPVVEQETASDEIESLLEESETETVEEEKIEINIPEGDEGDDISDEMEFNFNLTGEEKAAEPVEEQPPVVEAVDDSQDKSGFKKILVIDDSLVIRKMVEIALEEEEFSIETAVSGKEGLEVMDQTNPDLVILDMMLPDINGIEILKTIKASKGIPVIMLSGKDSPQMIETAKNEGAEEFLPKPFKDDDLVEKIKKLI